MSDNLEKLAMLIAEYEALLPYSGGQKWFQPGPYSIDNCPKHKLFFAAGKDYKERMFIAGNRCLAEGTLVATPRGPVAIQKLVPGDYVYDRYGHPTKVLATWDNGTQPVVSLTNRRKEYVVCTPDHEMDAVQLSPHDHKWDVKKNKEMRIEAGSLKKGVLVRRAYARASLGDRHVPSAYALGALLGDGCCNEGSSKRVIISSADSKVPAKVAASVNSDYGKTGGANYSWWIGWTGDFLYDLWMRGKRCHEKVLDLEEIKTWDRESLLNLVAGLVDTDGSMSKGRDGFALSFCNQSKSAIDVFAYACLALWQTQVTVSQDDRAKYVNGPVHVATIRNPHDIFRIVKELRPYLAHKYKADVSGIELIGKRSRSEAIYLTPVPAGTARVFDITVEHPEHFFLLANGISVSNCGKSLSGALEVSFHLTGNYPDWWEGKRFDKPVNVWAAGKTAQTTRDTIQKELVGPVGNQGTGTIPRDCIVNTYARAGTANALDTVVVSHVSGGNSVLGFKSYDQAIDSFMGTAQDVVWGDEEPPDLVWNEMIMRTMTTKGIGIITFTPLQGLTPLIINFHKSADKLGGAASITSEEAEEEEKLRNDNRKRTRAVIQAGWNDAPWLAQDEKEALLQGTPPHLRKSRSEGIPGVGAGNVYPMHIEDIVCDPFQIPAHWKRLYAMDVGWNVTAGLWMAINPETDEAFIYAEYYGKQELPQVHAIRFKEMSQGWIPGVIDPAARGRSQTDGNKLISIYRQQGLKLREAKNEVEAGIHRVWERLSNGKLKIFKNLTNLKNEFLIYRRDLNGRIIKENDHAIDCLRYLINSINYASAQHIDSPFTAEHSGGSGGGRVYY